jgi:hypothetical protein
LHYLSKHCVVWESDSVHRGHKMSPANLNKINTIDCTLFYALQTPGVNVLLQASRNPKWVVLLWFCVHVKCLVKVELW